ncbi:MAG: hypothetical protein HKN23_17765 [Verrucomicrobiales bacterium]|nr:hypothetical protein [Verrucomicrobiales bacterium]
MIHYIAFYTLKDGVTSENIEEMIRMSRSRLLKINEAHNVRSGRTIQEKSEFPFFVSADFESMDKLAIFREDPQNLKFEREVIQPHTKDCKEYLFETEPGKDIKYS